MSCLSTLRPRALINSGVRVLTEAAQADSDEGYCAGVGSERNGHRTRIGTVTGTHSALTSSRPGHTGVPLRRTKGRGDPANSAGRDTPLVRALALHGVSGWSGSHLGSTLKPGRAVLTGGVFRRSRSVAFVRADASPSEVHAIANNCTKTGVRQTRDLTHENCPRNTLGASRKSAREMVTVVRHGKWAVDDV